MEKNNRAILGLIGLCIFCIILSLNGKVSSMEIAKLKVIDNSNSQSGEWNHMDGKYCVVYFKLLPEEAATLMRAADVYFPMTAADFNWKRTEKPIFVLYHDKKEMAKTLGIEQSKPVPMGAYSQGRISVLSPSLWAEGGDAFRIDMFLEKGPVAHELVHFAMDDTLEGTYPLWLAEGVALYYENKYTGFEWRPDLREQSRLLNVQHLSVRFHDLPVDLAYRKSFDLVKHYVSVYGEEGLQQYLTSLPNREN